MTVLSRRTLLAGLAASPLLAACGRAEPDAGAAPASSAAARFTWTDARGTTIDLDQAPTSVVAQSSAAAALWDAGFQVKGAYGELKTTNGKLDYQAGNLDLSKIQVIGQSFGEFSLEKLAAVGPQLLVDLSFDDKTLWYVDAKVEQQVKALCPTLGMKMLDQDLVSIIDSFADLAARLGADPAVSASAKGQFDAATAELKTAITAAGGAKVAVLSFDATNAYVANADQAPDLAYLATLGAEFVRPDSKDYFATISYEKLGDYTGDIILVDARNTYTDYQKSAVWKSMPAVKAGRVFPWKTAAPYSYAASAPILRDLGTAYASVA